MASIIEGGTYLRLATNLINFRVAEDVSLGAQRKLKMDIYLDEYLQGEEGKRGNMKGASLFRSSCTWGSFN